MIGVICRRHEGLWRPSPRPSGRKQCGAPFGVVSHAPPQIRHRFFDAGCARPVLRDEVDARRTYHQSASAGRGWGPGILVSPVGSFMRWVRPMALTFSTDAGVLTHPKKNERKNAGPAPPLPKEKPQKNPPNSRLSPSRERIMFGRPGACQRPPQVKALQACPLFFSAGTEEAPPMGPARLLETDRAFRLPNAAMGFFPDAS